MLYCMRLPLCSAIHLYIYIYNCRKDEKKNNGQWLTGSFKEEVHAVREGLMSVGRPARKCSVPRATLQRHSVNKSNMMWTAIITSAG